MAQNGVPTSLDYLLGRGELFFSDSLDADGRPKGFRTLGNAEAFTVTVEAETLEHFSTLSGLKVKDRETVLSQAMNFAFQLSEIDAENLTMFMSGDQSSVAQTGATILFATADKNIVVSGLGQWYDFYDVAAPTVYPPTSGNRAYRISAVTVKDETQATTYVEGTDYELDLEMGRIFIIVGGAIGASDNLDIEFTYATLTISEVHAMTVAKFSGVLKFISRNANKSGDGSQVEYTFHQVSLTADGDFALIGDEFATLNVSGVAEQNLTVSPTSPTCTVRQLSA
jgi:hypothetical protein